MKKYSLSFLAAACVSLASLPAHSAPLADAAANYSGGTVGSPMTPLSDTFGTGTWTYNQSTVNTTSSPTAVSGLTPLTYAVNGEGGSAANLYGTGNSFQVPAVSNGQIFNDSPPPASGYLDVHPNGGANAVDVEWTAGAGETGAVKLAFDLSRVGVNGAGASGGAGFDDFTVYRNGTLLYSNYAMFVGSNTGPVTMNLSGVTVGTKLDFVLSATNGVLGFNLGYLSAQITAVPEPGTWALMLGGVALLITLQRVRRRSV